MTDSYSPPRCHVTPLPDHQVSIHADGRERLRWHHGPSYPRPFFYPLAGPEGRPLTRMGHPGAPDHDHHRSIWFAHADVAGLDFWSDQTDTRIRQLEWLCYEDGDAEARMAVKLGWFDGHDPRALLEQETILAVRDRDGETLAEFQLTFRPVSETLTFGKTNFGFLGVRVAKSISVHFGDGRLTDSQGREGETAIFGQRAHWMDYSGSIGSPPQILTGGITYFDHASNPGFPTHWHVREDGWMIASACLRASLPTTRSRPLVLRYLLHAHRGQVHAPRADEIAREFAARPPLRLVKSADPHVRWELRREG